MKYPALASELVKLLKQDQKEWRDFAKLEFETEDKSSLQDERKILRHRARTRAQRALQILGEIGEPSLSNIGADAAQALSILALHDSLSSLRIVLDSFIVCFENFRDDTFFQAIPSMTDWALLLEKKPQKFGTIWLFDENKQPFLPTVEGFESVNDRREEYRIEPLRWPKSLAIPEESQPWLKRPLSELVMREPTQKEYEEFSKDYLD